MQYAIVRYETHLFQWWSQ